MQSAYSPPILFDDEYCAQRTDLFQPYKFPYVLHQKKKLKLQYSYLQCNSTNDFRLVFSGHIFEPSTDVRTVCCVRKIEEKEWESYFDGRWCLSSLFHQTCRSHFSHPIYRILNFTPARTLNNWAKGKSHLFSLAIEIQVPFLHP